MRQSYGRVNKIVQKGYSSRVRVETVRSLYQFSNKQLTTHKHLKQVYKNRVNGYDRPASDRNLLKFNMMDVMQHNISVWSGNFCLLICL